MKTTILDLKSEIKLVVSKASSFKTENNNSAALYLNDLLCLDYIISRIFSPLNNYNQFANGDVNFNLQQLITDTQSFYVFAAKCMLGTYDFYRVLLLENNVNIAGKYTKTHNNFMDYVMKHYDESSLRAYKSFGKSLSMLDKQIYFKRNKMIEHWMDYDSNHRYLIPTIYALDVPILTYENSEKWNQYIGHKTEIISWLDRKISSIKTIKLGHNVSTAQKMAIIAYYYPKLSLDDMKEYDQYERTDILMCLPVSPYLVEKIKLFINDVIKSVKGP